MSTPQPPAGPYGMYETPPPAAEPRNNTYGVVAVSLGGVGALFGLIPLTFFLAFLLGIPALVLTGFAWFKSNKVLAGFATAATVLALVLGSVGAAVMGDVAGDLENLGGPSQSDINAGLPSGSAPSPAAADPSLDRPAEPKVVLDVSKHGITATDEFQVSGKFEVTYDYTCDSPYGMGSLFALHVYPGMTSVVTEIATEGGGTRTIYESDMLVSGPYHLKTSSGADSCDWDVKVTDLPD